MKIEVKGVNVDLSFGLYFLGKVLKKYDSDLVTFLALLQKNPLAEFVDVMYFCIECNADLDGIKPPITKREFVNFLQDNDDFNNKEGVLANFSKGLITSINGHFTPNQEDENDSEEVKKK